MNQEQDKFDLFEDFLEDAPKEQIIVEDEIQQISPYLITQTDFSKLRNNLEKTTQSQTQPPQIFKTELQQNCILETIIKPGMDSTPFKIDITETIENPAKSYKFTLDPFQKAAVHSVSKNTSVLVSAHTSAGKTAVAEYVIAECLRKNQRVIYTSPIKALSNQKYRDLKKEFNAVGLITGDITIDENSTCLIMTTEILRNMLFKSNEIAKETAWIIFDEVHYLKDRERGVVWEETIILAPKNVRYCLLSATTPNSSELAQWILKVKNLDCINVVYTDYRPTPLLQYSFMPGIEKLLLIKGANGEVNEKNLSKIGELTKGDEIGERKKRNPQKPEQLLKIVKLIKNKNMSPCIIFAFSKKDVENYAKIISKKEKLNTQSEINSIEQWSRVALDSLSTEDKKLPMITDLIEILKSGVGLHHGGMLPILKELVEILFQIGLIKVLVSTETFSMGVNMPAKCVIFSTVQKWDGDKFRVLQGSEFVQMSGRAGRRGIDLRGTVITLLDESVDIKQFISMLRKESKYDPLISQFTISYNMLLNSLLMEGFSPEEMIQQSFKQFQHEELVDKKRNLLGLWSNRMNTIFQQLGDEGQIDLVLVKEIYKAQKDQKKTSEKLRQVLCNSKIILPFLSIGRVINIKGLGWCIFINFQRNEKKNFILEVLAFANYTKNKLVSKSVFCYCNQCLDKFGLVGLKEPKVLETNLEELRQVSAIVLTLPSTIVQLESKIKLRETMNRVIREFKHELELLKLIQDIPIQNDNLQNEIAGLMEQENNQKKIVEDQKEKFIQKKQNDKRIYIFRDLSGITEILQKEIEESELFYDQSIINKLFQIKPWNDKQQKKDKKKQIEKEILSFQLLLQFSKKLKNVIEKTEGKSTLVLHNKKEGMKKVLKRLELIDKKDVVTQKGRVASMIFGSNELLLTELLFSGEISKLNSKNINIIMSLFVNEEKKKETDRVKTKDEKLVDIFDYVVKTLLFINSIYKQSDLDYKEDDEVSDELNPSMFQVIQKWCEGVSFLDITKITDLYEGSIIRSIKRLHELLRQLIECANALGNKDLKQKFEEGSNKLFRGIVFAASLYIEN